MKTKVNSRIAKIIFVNFLVIFTLIGFGISYFSSETTDSKISPKMNTRNANSIPGISQYKPALSNGKTEIEIIEKSDESTVPWQELNEKWDEELKNFLITINDKEGLKMFNSYVDARTKYLKENVRLGERYQQIHATKTVDPLKVEQLTIESGEAFKNSSRINKKIFGKHYHVVKKFHKEFEESIQVYSRDMPISLDFGFDE